MQKSTSEQLAKKRTNGTATRAKDDQAKKKQRIIQKEQDRRNDEAVTKSSWQEGYDVEAKCATVE